MSRLIVEKFPSVATLYSVWLVLLYLIVAYAIVSGEMLYRMEQVVDYLGNLPISSTRENSAMALMVIVLFAELIPLWLGAIMIRLKTPQRIWMSWPLTVFCLAIAYTVVQNTKQLYALYYKLIGPLDWAFAMVTVSFMVMIIIVIHATDYYNAHSSAMDNSSASAT
ncbi:MAG: hypothetical protein JKY67_02910 [Pseudomonadales bacterium]|nr:hypothetical protein [Pseudomonadales bacterium]